MSNDSLRVDETTRAINDLRNSLVNDQVSWNFDDDGFVCINGEVIESEYSVQTIRASLRGFKKKTSIGCDLWCFKTMSLMPDPILASLGSIITAIKKRIAPTYHMLINTMAIIPKKDRR